MPKDLAPSLKGDSVKVMDSFVTFVIIQGFFLFETFLLLQHQLELLQAETLVLLYKNSKCSKFWRPEKIKFKHLGFNSNQKNKMYEGTLASDLKYVNLNEWHL